MNLFRVNVTLASFSVCQYAVAGRAGTDVAANGVLTYTAAEATTPSLPNLTLINVCDETEQNGY